MSSIPPLIFLPPHGATSRPNAARALLESRAGEHARPVAAVGRAGHSRDEARARQSGRSAEDSRPSQGREEGQALVVLAPPATGAERPGAAPGFLSSQFLVQMLSQESGPSVSALARHRDGPALGSAAYRRAGAEPAGYTEQPTIFRVAI